MQDPPPPAVGNVPRENPLFGDANDNTLGDPLAPPQLPANLHMARNEQTLRYYALPSLDMVYESITRLAITTDNFKIKPAMIQMI
ncbi:hypothetical protein EPI10_030682 [Gossypium australe]|uniref:Uncharacterized protein n=1 Tax=Gossypium australe TaxID=47621 RepID=A0A5B6WXX9_9ROSI|nr:hypothetical protein EPI10_030682 [Gossypium australe]